VNLSEGAYDDGEGELEDARLCLAYLRDRYPDLPYTLAGFSFGSRIILRTGCASKGAARLIAGGFPTMYKSRGDLETCTVPRVFVQSTRDQYGPVEEIEPLVASLPDPKKLILVEAQDHFFASGLEELEQVIKQVGREG